MNLHHLRVALEASADRTPPSAFRVFASGIIDTTKGLFKFDELAAAKVMAAVKEWGNDFPVDYGHGMVDWMPADPGAAGVAAGWFRPELRGGELWAVDVRWTDRAAGYIRAGEYRYISPAFQTDDDSRIARLVNVALTNLPATKNLPALVPADQCTRPTHPETTMADDPKTGEELTKLRAEHSALTTFRAQVHALTGTTGDAEALGTLHAMKRDASAAAELRAQVETDRKAAAAKERAELLDGAVAAMKLTPAERAADGGPDAWTTALTNDGLRTYLSRAGAPGPAPRQPSKASPTGAGLTDDQRAIANQLGLDVDAYARSLAAQG